MPTDLNPLTIIAAVVIGLATMALWRGGELMLRRTTDIRRSKSKERETRIQALARRMDEEPDERLYLRAKADHDIRSALLPLIGGGFGVLTSPLSLFGGSPIIGGVLLLAGSVLAGVGIGGMRQAGETREADKRVHLGLGKAEEGELDVYESLSTAERTEYVRDKFAELEQRQREARAREFRQTLQDWGMTEAELYEAARQRQEEREE